jgi:hypothetical protein
VSTPTPCYTIEFGSRIVRFYPLLLKQIRDLGPPPPPAERTPEALYQRQMRALLLSAQRGDPSVTMEDVESVVDTAHHQKLTMAVYSASGLSTAVAGAEVPGEDPTRPQTGG